MISYPKDKKISFKHEFLIAIAGGCWITLFLIFVAPFDTADQPFIWRAQVMAGYGLAFVISYMLTYPFQVLIYRLFQDRFILKESIVYFILFSINLVASFIYYKTEIINGDYSFGQFFLEIYIPTLMIFVPLIVITKWLVLTSIEKTKQKKSYTDDDIDIKEWIPKIELQIKEQVYLDASLTLQKMAQLLNTNTSILSRVINQGYDCNFNDFINKHRLQAVIESIEKGENETLTISGIAENCGFKSRATFNRAFKKHFKCSPSEYISSNSTE